jgi:vacuolar-type H+-ATPase subunit E/Vma4
MSSLDALLDALERDAAAEAARLVSQAEQQAGEIRARAVAEQTRRRAEAIGRIEAEGRREVARAAATASRRFLESRLRERARVLEQIFGEAAVELGAASPDRYRALLPGMLQETLRFLAGTPAVLTCRPEIAAEVEAALPGDSGVTVYASRDAAAGILGQSAEGGVVVDDTLPALLRRRQAELAIALAVRLEAG